MSILKSFTPLIKSLTAALSLCAFASVGFSQRSPRPKTASPVNDIKAYLFSGTNESAPAEETFFNYLSRRHPDLNFKEWAASWQLWESAQHPGISLEDLRKLITIKRNSISKVKLEYAVRYYSGSKNTQADRAYHAIFAREGNRYYSRATDDGDPQNPIIKSYDGEVVRIFRTFMWSSSRGPQRASFAEIKSFKSREMFLDSNDPLIASKLLHYNTDIDGSWKLYDLAARLDRKMAVVQGAPEKAGGADCLVVCIGVPSTFKVYLNPEKGFAIVKFAAYRIQAADNNVATSRHVDFTTSYDQLADFGNGIWLPRQIVMRWYDPPSADGKPRLSGSRTVHLINGSINQPIPEALFKRIFPKGVEVTNDITGEHYINGAAPFEPTTRPTSREDHQQKERIRWREPFRRAARLESVQ